MQTIGKLRAEYGQLVYPARANRQLAHRGGEHRLHRRVEPIRRVPAHVPARGIIPVGDVRREAGHGPDHGAGLGSGAGRFARANPKVRDRGATTRASTRFGRVQLRVQIDEQHPLINVVWHITGSWAGLVDAAAIQGEGRCLRPARRPAASSTCAAPCRPPRVQPLKQRHQAGSGRDERR
jgi:hypothetical protein